MSDFYNASQRLTSLRSSGGSMTFPPTAANIDTVLSAGVVRAKLTLDVQSSYANRIHRRMRSTLNTIFGTLDSIKNPLYIPFVSNNAGTLYPIERFRFVMSSDISDDSKNAEIERLCPKVDGKHQAKIYTPLQEINEFTAFAIGSMVNYSTDPRTTLQVLNTYMMSGLSHLPANHQWLQKLYQNVIYETLQMYHTSTWLNDLQDANDLQNALSVQINQLKNTLAYVNQYPVSTQNQIARTGLQATIHYVSDQYSLSEYYESEKLRYLLSNSNPTIARYIGFTEEDRKNVRLVIESKIAMLQKMNESVSLQVIHLQNKKAGAPSPTPETIDPKDNPYYRVDMEASRKAGYLIYVNVAKNDNIYQTLPKRIEDKSTSWDQFVVAQSNVSDLTRSTITDWGAWSKVDLDTFNTDTGTPDEDVGAGTLQKLLPWAIGITAAAGVALAGG